MAMGRDQGLDLLKQEVCDAKSDEQRFTCKGNTMTPVKDSGLCVTASGNYQVTYERVLVSLFWNKNKCKNSL